VNPSYVYAFSDGIPENLQFFGYVRMRDEQEKELRGIDEIEGDVDGWFDFYGNFISGIFLDGVPNIYDDWSGNFGKKEDQIIFIEQITNYIKIINCSHLVAVNAGGPSFREYYNFVDFSVIFEDSTQYWTGDQSGTCQNQNQNSGFDEDVTYFGPGAFCKYVRNLDGVDNLKTDIETHTIPTMKSVALLYGANSANFDPLSISKEILSYGVGIFWYYIVDLNCGDPNWENCWGELASSELLDGLTSAINSYDYVIGEQISSEDLQFQFHNSTRPYESLEAGIIVVGVITFLSLFLALVAICIACRNFRRQEDEYHLQQW